MPPSSAYPITATANKATAGSRLGLLFTRKDRESPLIIQLIHDDSAFIGTDLKAGMIVGSIMGENMTWKAPLDAAAILRDAPAGLVTITAAKPCIGEISRKEAAQKVALSVHTRPDKAGVFIRKIHSDGPLAGSGLAEGQQLLTINGKPCPNDTKEAIELVKQSVDKLHLVAVPVAMSPSAATAADEREEIEAPRNTMDTLVKDNAGNKNRNDDDNKIGTRTGAVVIEEQILHEKEKGSIFDQIFAPCIC